MENKFEVISSVSSKSDLLTRTTSAMECGSSVVIQVYTEKRNQDGSYAISESLATVADSYIDIELNADGSVSNRSIESNALSVPQGQ